MHKPPRSNGELLSSNLAPLVSTGGYNVENATVNQVANILT